jgi:hypothetical protein
MTSRALFSPGASPAPAPAQGDQAAECARTARYSYRSGALTYGRMS